MSKASYNAPSLQHKADHWMNPNDIIIEEPLNGRFEAHSEDDVRNRAFKFLKYGQLQPVAVRRDTENDSRPKLVFGYLRTKAAKYINDVFLPAGGVEVPGKGWVAVTEPFKLWCADFKGSDLDSLKRNVMENLDRKPTTVMDMVVNQKKLKDAGLSIEEIAELYDCEVQTVTHYAPLLDHPENVQTMIHHGFLSAEAGLDLLKLTPEERETALKDLKADSFMAEKGEQEFLHHIPTGSHADFKKPAKISTAEVKAKVRSIKENKGEAGPGRTMREVNKFFETLAESEDEAIKEFAKSFLRFRKGKITEKQMVNAVNKLHDHNAVEFPRKSTLAKVA